VSKAIQQQMKGSANKLTGHHLVQVLSVLKDWTKPEKKLDKMVSNLMKI
jgi:hypothetical protein